MPEHAGVSRLDKRLRTVNEILPVDRSPVDLSSSEFLDNYHGAAAVWAKPDCARLGLIGARLCGLPRIVLQQLLTESQKLFAAPIREESGKTDTDEPARQDMKHEATQELFGGHRHLALLATVSVVLPAEGDLSISDRQ